jgi:hypothetical protein
MRTYAILRNRKKHENGREKKIHQKFPKTQKKTTLSHEQRL